MSENKPNDDPKLSTTDRVVKCEYPCALFGDRQGFLGYFKCKMVLMSAAKPSVPSAAHGLGHWYRSVICVFGCGGKRVLAGWFSKSRK